MPAMALQASPPCSPLHRVRLQRNPLAFFSFLQDQYLEVSTHISRSATLYGAGERASEAVAMTVRWPSLKY